MKCTLEESKKNGLSILFFRPIDTSAESWHPQLSIEGSTSPYFLPNHSFFVTWRNNKNSGTAGYFGTAYAVPGQGNQYGDEVPFERLYCSFCFVGLFLKRRNALVFDSAGSEVQL
jgi:hypothetical protein